MTTNRLLTCGIVAGPLFVTVALVQAMTRSGYDLGRHPVSLLSLGDLGFVQIANFIVSGALFVACSIGLRRSIDSVWGPRLVGSLGVGLIVAGIFVTDPGAGYPIGAPEGAPEFVSWHGIVHEVGFLLAVPGMLIGCVVFARHYMRRGAKAWAGAAVAAAVSSILIGAFPSTDGMGYRMLASAAVLFAYVAALAVQSLRPIPAVRAEFALQS